MQAAIKLAVEGGYIIKPSFQDWVTEKATLHSGDVLLDPLFWEALGKALGLSQDKPKQSFSTEFGVITSKVLYSGHIGEWHHFIDHLAGGGDIDPFFKGLIEAHTIKK